jgi:hypothetical protein
MLPDHVLVSFPLSGRAIAVYDIGVAPAGLREAPRNAPDDPSGY